MNTHVKTHSGTATVVNETMQKLYASYEKAFKALKDGDDYGFCEEWYNAMDMRGYDFATFRAKAAEHGITVTPEGSYHLAH